MRGKMDFLGSALLGYFLGGINPSYLFGKMKGIDIRQMGSGNAGASNAMIMLGKSFGVISALFDIAKAYLSYRLAAWLFSSFALAGITAGTFCIIGHAFPLFMDFKGGKGLACLAGVAIAFNPVVFLILLAIEAVLVFTVNYLCVVPITASVMFNIVYGVMTKSVPGTLIFLIATLVILYRHVENIKRIRMGIEVRLSFLWDRKRELERVLGNYDGSQGDRGIDRI